MQGRRGRPPKPLDPTASIAAWLGAELRKHRQEQGLTLQALGTLINYSPQYISEIERAKAPPTQQFIAACDHALNACGRLLALMPAVMNERETQRQERVAARRAEANPALRCAAQDREAGEDVDPTNRRGLLAATALGSFGAVAATPVPASARQIDPELSSHWMGFLGILDEHTAAFGHRDVLDRVRRELDLIAEHRKVASGELRVQLLRVEARWTAFAAYLANDTGQSRIRDAWADRALQLAREANYPDLVAYVLMRRSLWATPDARRATALADAGYRVRGTATHVRGLCALRAAHGHALANDATSCERSLADARDLLHPSLTAPKSSEASPLDRLGDREATIPYVAAEEARCWLRLQPRRAITGFENVLREWPRERVRGRGIHQAHLALACAASGEHDRASAEGRKAFAIARATESSVALRELKRLGIALRAS
jgi:transcriptional regulator with XRE-family HTH domain